MKNYLLVLMTFLTCYAYSQIRLEGSWVKVKVERKDGSKVVDHTNINEAYLEYKFSNQNVQSIAMTAQKTDNKYVIKGSTLKIGSLINYKIEQLTDTFLVLLEVPNEELADDKYNRFYFMKQEYYVDYLLNQKSIPIENDTVILASNYLFPVFSGGNFTQIIFSEVSSLKKCFIALSFIISPDNEILNILLSDNNEENLSVDEQIKNKISNTKGKWDLPKSGKRFYYKINFQISNESNAATNFNFFMYQSNVKNNYPLTVEERNSADKYFNKGLKLATKNNFVSSIEEFTKCIAIDPIYLDAYYNRAFSNYQLKNYDEACKDWKYLKDLGQKTGEALYLQNCKN